MSSIRTNSVQFGNNGALFIDDTAEHTGDFAVFVPHSTVVIDSITTKSGNVSIENVGGMSGKTFLAGSPIYGWITSIKLASGYGMAYKGTGA